MHTLYSFYFKSTFSATAVIVSLKQSDHKAKDVKKEGKKRNY